ncbi:hypothetical protein GCM10011341_38850 [Frigidibacter albus]|uniref:hypothetical protein n=1 Tax=Frigidibacter albus TaxID=1465486 RepID=UPI0019A374E8|nr:hypothetical protein [Frigidibacter albus]GGH63616.1 hypothetical protein GCM10011341_38850 [Frigidibacter albus]
MKRPTLDDLQREQENFIGPPKPPRGPKFARALSESEGLYLDAILTIHVFRAALEDDQPIDPERLPDRLVEAIEKQGGASSMPIVEGRPHYSAADVLKA